MSAISGAGDSQQLLSKIRSPTENEKGRFQTKEAITGGRDGRGTHAI